ncbi:spore germination protein [Gorillibacterium timonense]|uniref:spore germination protein n=1 Tax=Gorillibacterium timonense TaxID=1689269 RepID=UPI00071D4AF3|nr:spore germination protein [Gorillibacterium timonense]
MWSMLAGYIPEWKVFFQGIVIVLVPILLSWSMNRIRRMDAPYSNESAANHEEKASAGSDSTTGSDDETKQEDSIQVTGRYEEDLRQFKEISSDMTDVNIREIRIGTLKIKAALFFTDGLTDKVAIDQNILKPLMTAVHPFEGMNTTPDSEKLKQILIQEILHISEIEPSPSLDQSLEKLLFGSAILLVDGMKDVLVLGTTHAKTRGPEEPVSEALLRGPRVGFNETLSDNTAMLRRHGQSSELAMHSFHVGKRMKKELVLVYFRDIANDDLVNEVKRRIRKIDLDDVQESGYVEQLIEDNFLSPFQQIQNTERPDRVIAALLEGRVAILLDGTPFALIMPVTFEMLLQSPEDYYDRWYAGSLLRTMRFFAAAMSLFAPALYISFLSFHPGMIPTKLAISIINSRQGVPFPTLIEALILEISIEILREAGLRLPKPIGPAMGIVGGLIIGQAAVEAGIVSPILVIVVAVTAISSFSIPVYSAGITLRYLRFAVMLFAGVFGLFGVVLFFLLLSSHLIRLKTFGFPYMSMASPLRISTLKDALVRLPLQTMKKRPTIYKPKKSIRKR